LFDNTLKYTYISQPANINRQQAAFLAENRTNRPATKRFVFGAGHAKKHYLSSQTRF